MLQYSVPKRPIYRNTDIPNFDTSYPNFRYIEVPQYLTSIFRIETSDISKYINVELRYIVSNAFWPPSPVIPVFRC